MASGLAGGRVRSGLQYTKKKVARAFTFTKPVFHIISPEIKHLRDTVPILFLKEQQLHFYMDKHLNCISKMHPHVCSRKQIYLLWAPSMQIN